MRIRTATAAALVTALAFTAGCSSSDDNKAEAKPKPTPPISKTTRFLNAVHEADFASWADKGPTDEELLDYPAQWCDALAAGHSVDYMFSGGGGDLYPIGMDWGTKEADAHELLLLGVTAYCPKYREQVAQELRDGGGY
ncbi:hypothetical protein [Streptomyces antimycoticus]|uniref:hypothetical protein n=1 Tax=Streptomyces antimycoticus TaxID=68175 RepID=UPI000A37BDF0|nr:hypothetical protein [Streptomyces antimycoticus]